MNKVKHRALRVVVASIVAVPLYLIGLLGHKRRIKEIRTQYPRLLWDVLETAEKINWAIEGGFPI